MTLREALLKTKAWVDSEIEKSKKPYADAFDLTSLSFCVGKGVNYMENWQVSEETLSTLRWITLAKGLPTHDVYRPSEVLQILAWAMEMNPS